MKILKGEKVYIRKLLREDVDKMQCWATHEDPLYFHYNFPKMNKEQSDEWYRIKTKKLKRKSFSIESKDGEVIGYLSIRDMKWMRRESELGIVFDAQYINQGYGKEAIILFLDYYFNILKMKTLILRAAKFNKRAIKCYTSCGFEIVKESMDEFEDQYAEIFYNPLYSQLRRLFIISGGKKKTCYVHMKVSKEEFYKKINSLPTKPCVSVE
ncbi:GNAT family N-acetyltransferase [Crassaminicella profunda]|uniref:GNAT family N-acetyltransferase n=1 Tax=Crassaminicella profunda TaxID=1286698 RepID=UPI001CA76611|nr:GNAT family N-acetyltransferase [Crassaminicella profunda]QZY55130.1 GNAT family N-acetyltransferase [Crassaminicella profunda]